MKKMMMVEMMGGNEMHRGDEPITKEQAIEFCREKAAIHRMGAERVAEEECIKSDIVAKVKYDSQIELSKIYDDIADYLAE